MTGDLLEEERELGKKLDIRQKDPYTLFNPKLVCFVLTSGTHIVDPYQSTFGYRETREKKERFISCMKGNKTLEGNKKSSRRKTKEPTEYK
jgi:hypothetical protein